MVSEQHATIGRQIVGAVLVDLRRGGELIAWPNDRALDEPGVETEPDDVGADRGDDEPDRVDRLAANEGDHRPGDGPDECDGGEREFVACAHRCAVDDGDRWQVFVGPDVGDAVAGLLDALHGQ